MTSPTPSMTTPMVSETPPMGKNHERYSRLDWS
jgi:hypothetical protein